MVANKKARTSTEQSDRAVAMSTDEGEEDGDSTYDEEDVSESEESDSDDEEELEALQLLSEQIQEAKRANQVLKQALIATAGDKKKDNSSSELVASLMAGRKGGNSTENSQAGTLLSALEDQKPAGNGT